VTRRRPARPDAAPIRFDSTWLRARLRELVGSLRTRRLCLAFSGGLDSTALLYALAQLRAREGFKLRALHVNHQLHPLAGEWARAAQATARRLHVPCEIVEIEIARPRGESLEAAARAARYAALKQQLESDELLLTAHHQEDQLETILLALFRGSGVRGLSAMQAVTNLAPVQLLRPLLPVSRAQLTQYAHTRGFKWSEDPSNEDDRFDRNYLRRAVLPALRRRWPAVASTASRSAAHLAEARTLLDQLAREALSEAYDGAALRVSVLRRLPMAERCNALRLWIAERGLPPPDQKRLMEMAGPLLAARQDSQACVCWRGGQLRRHADRLLAQCAGADRAKSAGAQALRWDWRRQRSLPLHAGGTFGIVPDRHGDVLLSALPPILEVQFRRGGERVRAEHGSVAVKDLLQKNALPPWQRDSVPLLMHDKRIIAVGDLWLDPRYRADSSTGAGQARLRWRRLRQSP
jgi:tRNA(Ile)-lysidine synthase